MRDHEGARFIGSKPRATELQLAENIIRQSGGRVIGPTKGIMSRPRLPSPYAAMIRNACIPLVAESTNERYEVLVPQVLIIHSSVINGSGEGAGEIMWHEFDHWQFLKDEGGNIQSSRSPYSPLELKTIVEKRGYRTSHRIASNLGRYARFSDLEEFVSSLGEVGPEQAPVVIKAIRERDKGMDMLTTRTLAAIVLEHMFSKSDERVTSDEVTAYHALGII